MDIFIDIFGERKSFTIQEDTSFEDVITELKLFRVPRFLQDVFTHNENLPDYIFMLGDNELVEIYHLSSGDVIRIISSEKMKAYLYLLQEKIEISNESFLKCKNINVAEAFIKFGININIADKTNFTLLHYACLRKYTELAKYLLKNGACLNAKTDYGWTPLYCSVSSVNYELSEHLLKNGANANVNLTLNGGWTPLHYTLINNHMDIFKLLLKYKADIEAKDNDGSTPLHYVKDYNIDICRLLIDSGSNINAKDNGGKTPLHYAKLFNDDEIRNLLIKHGAN